MQHMHIEGRAGSTLRDIWNIYPLSQRVDTAGPCKGPEQGVLCTRTLVAMSMQTDQAASQKVSRVAQASSMLGVCGKRVKT